MVDQKSILKPMVQAALSWWTIAVYNADWAAPTKFIHVVSDNCAGYLFKVYAWKRKLEYQLMLL